MHRKAEDNVDGLPLRADHIVPLAISDRRHVVSDLSNLRLVLGSCNTGRGDRTRTRARRVDRDGYPMQRAKPTPPATRITTAAAHQRPGTAPRPAAVAGRRPLADVPMVKGRGRKIRGTPGLTPRRTSQMPLPTKLNNSDVK
jgi:hypothetical protein